MEQEDIFLAHNSNCTDSNVQACLKKVQHNQSEIFYTSGTTGTPKQLVFSQAQIKASVALTLNYFKLKAGDTLVNPLDLNFVAGKMNVYRAIYGGLKYLALPPAQIHLNFPDCAVDFVTLVPNQLQQLIKHNVSLTRVKKVLIGGGVIGAAIPWSNFPATQFFHSFAMTETLTHFALKDLTQKNETYTVLDGYTVDTNDIGQLKVQHPVICPIELITDEIIVVNNNKSFTWLGRKNTMIKCGGVKLFPELIEAKLKTIFPFEFVILGKQDDKFGEIPVICIEGNIDEAKKIIYLKQMQAILSKYEVPKMILSIVKFPRTQSMKIKRHEIGKLVLNQ